MMRLSAQRSTRTLNLLAALCAVGALLVLWSAS